MTIFDLRHYLASQGFSNVSVLNINKISKNRDAKNPDYLSASGQLNYLWKLVAHSMSGYILHIETNGHNFKSWLSIFVCVMAGVLNGRRTIVALGSGNVPEYLNNVSFWKKIVIGMALKLAGVIICRNRAMVEAVQAFGIELSRIRIVPGFVGIESRMVGSAPENVRLFCDSHAPILGAAVMMSPEYGIPLLCESVKHLKDLFPKIGLVLMGVGPEVACDIPELSGIEDRVVFAGHLSPGIMVAVMKELRVFVRPTFFDGDSLSVREALAVGIPVLASATPGRPAGVIEFRVGDCSDLCRKLEDVLSQASLKYLPNKQIGSGPTLLQLYLDFAK